VTIPQTTPDRPERVLALLRSLGTARNLVTDAQIAAIAVEQDGVLHTAKVDLIHFQGLQWSNPLKGDGPPASRGPRRTT